MFKDNKP